MRQHILEDYLQSQKGGQVMIAGEQKTPVAMACRPLKTAAVTSNPALIQLYAMSSLAANAQTPAGNGALMVASFAPFKPKVRFCGDESTFYVEGDNMPDGMPNRMVGITTWQQQVPLPVAYFANTTNPEHDTAALSYGQPNYWRLPLVPKVAATPTPIFTVGSTNNNFQRGAVALASNGVAIFNPANNTGKVSYEIGELDCYGGHSGLADDYHYHIIPTHLYSRFGGPLSDDKAVAWGLDGYPIYGYVEPDGSARQALDSLGGHDIGNGWGYHYHAVGNTTTDAAHPYGTPQSPYMMTSFKGTVVNYGGQVDGQPEVGAVRQDGTGGYNAKPIQGASFPSLLITAFKNPVALKLAADGNSTQGTAAIHLAEDVSGTPSADSYLMRYTLNGGTYDCCWQINRNANPKTLTVTWRAPSLVGGQLSLPMATTTTTYTPAAGTASGNRLPTYPLAGWSEAKLPDTGQTLDATATFGEDSDYTVNFPSLTDNGNGTITDNVTGLMWQKVDAGETTWANAVTNASAQATAGYTDWRLPTPAELFGILNHNNNPALDLTKFSNANNAEYWWTSDIYGTDATKVWCTNAGGGLGPKPITETLSAGGTLRFCARYVRGGKPNNGHNYLNNNDGTITDADTGLMWTQVPASPMSWSSALSYAEGLTLGGYDDWRLPNIKELQTLTDYMLATATGTTGVKAAINRTLFAKTLTNCITTAGGTVITCDDTSGLIPGMVLVDAVNPANVYLPGTTPPVVASVTSTASFTVTSGAGILASAGQTYKALVPPTAYWSSTVQKAGTLTSAWLVEMGINNSVPAQNGPARNSQGIISYEVFSSTYPVFAVRTTSAATQIAVSQGSNVFTDGVSSVGFTAPGAKTFSITNNGVTSLTLNAITIDGTNSSAFTLAGAPATPATLAPNASTTFSVLFSTINSGSYSAVLHIANNDPATAGSFDVNLTASVPAIDSVALKPAVPSNGDSPYVSAKISPPAGKTLSSVQLAYSVGTGSTTTATVFNETMSGTPTINGWNGTGASNSWTTVIVNGNGNVNQTGAASNHTAAILLNNCTVSGSTVTCSSTTGLWPAMIVTGTGIPAGDTISAVSSSTTFSLASPAANGTGISVTVAGVTPTSCATNSTTTVVSSTTTSGSPTIAVASASGIAVGNVVTGTGIPGNTFVTAISGTNITLSSNASASGTVNITFGGNAVTCASTTGLVAGMGITGTGIPANSTVYQITGATSFLLSNAATATNSGQTFTATGCGLQFNKGQTGTPCSATTAGSINVSGPNNGTTSTSALISFWASASNITTAGMGWSLQLSTDGGATWPASTSTGAITEFAAANHGFTQYTYPLQQSELSSDLKLRFNFLGNGTGGAGAAKLALDDIAINKITTVTPPVFTVTMYDDGTHGDAVAGDGVYTGQITDNSARTTGAAVNFSITANYSDSTSATLSNAGSFTVTAPVAITASTVLPGALTTAAYTQSLTASGGSGSGYTWSVSGGSLPPGLTFGTDGTFGGTPSAAGSYTFTATVTDSSGHTASQTFSLIVKTPPNIVIIVTDDQGWGDIGYHTYPGRIHIDTPNMDSFATSGIRMERFYPTAVCSVTRACLQTGRNTIRTGVNNSRGLDLSEHILPQTFSAAGYQTFITGKWHCGGPENNNCYTTVNGQTVRIIQEGDQYRPFNRGWGMHYGEYGVIDAFTHYESGLLNPVSQPTWLRPDWWLNGTQYADGDASQHTDSQGHGGYATDLLADKAVSIITNASGDRDTSKPLLLYLPFSQIHGPVAAPPEYLAKYGNASDPTHYIADVPTRTIAASVDCMDVAMGRVLNALNTAGMTNNTLVLFMSDNGGENATGGSDLPLRGAKTEPYDGGIRTPCGIRYPGQLAGGLQVTHCVTASGSTAVTCDSTAGLYPGMALAGSGLAYNSTVASVTDGTHFVLSAAPAAASSPSSFTVTAGVISNLFFWVGDVFPTLCAATGVTPLNTKPFDGLNMWPALQSISGANPDGMQTRFQTNPDGTKNNTTPNISPLVTLASPNVAFNVYTDPVSGQPKVFKNIYSQNTSAVILTHCATVTGSTTVTCDSTAGLTAGGSLYGPGIKGSATVAAITDATHFVMSSPPNAAYASITLNVGFPTNQLFNIQDDPYETTDCMLPVNQAALGLTPAQISQFTTIAFAMQASITGISPNVYPPYAGPVQIANTVAQGGTIQLYVPFTSYAKNPPVINWRKNGVNLADGTTASGSTLTGSTTFSTNTTSPDTGYGNPSVLTNGAYTTILTITNATYGDAGSYDLVISNVDTYQAPNVTNTVYAPAGTLTVAVGAPLLTTLPAFTKGTSQTVSWSAVTGATSYTVQAATDINFNSIISTKTGSATSAAFTGLSNATQYWFRATATDGTTTSVFSNIVTSIQDAVNPAVTITSPANGSLASQPTITVTGTASDAGAGVASVTVNGVAATTSDSYAHWSATLSLSVGGNTISATALDDAQPGGNSGTASVTVALSPTSPVISSVSTSPTAPTYLDPVTVRANVQPGTGAALTQVQLSFTTGTPVTSTVFRELFSNTGTNNWDGTVSLGALNPWTKTAVRNASDVRQAAGSANNSTSPILLSSCATTSGSTIVTCASTANLWPGMLITGTNITSNTKVASITDDTSFAISANAIGTGGGLTLTAAGATLTNGTTTSGSTTVTCDTTTGLLAGMGLSGIGLANNATVSSITNGTTFVMSAIPVSAGSSLTFSASGAGAELINSTANLSDTMIASTNGINLTGGSAGYVEFYLATNSLAATNNCQWAFQVSPDGGTTWNTRLSENWNTQTVNLANGVLNTTGNTGGSTIVTCTSTAGLAAGQSVTAVNLYVTGNVTNGSAVVSNTNTSTLAVGMFVSGAGGSGIPNNARILSIDSGTQFTMSVNSTATGTGINIAATYFASNAAVISVTNLTTFVLNTAAYVNTTSSPISVSATTANHAFSRYHYDLASNELTSNVKLRFQYAGYVPQAPTKAPNVSIDDIVVVKTTPAAPTLVTMYDDGLHGDGAAGDGVYAAQIPVLAGGTSVNFTITATDSHNTSTTSASQGYVISSSLTNAAILNAEHLSMPSDQGITVNVVAASAQEAFIEYGTLPGTYTGTTPVTTFNTPGVNGVFPVAITLSGLQQNTRYYYRLHHRSVGGASFNARGERSFHTARSRGSPFVFTIFADPHLDVNTYSDPNDTAHVPQLLNRALDNVAADQPDFHMDLGDILMTDKLTLTDGTGIPDYWGGSLGLLRLNLSNLCSRASTFRSCYERTTHSVPFIGTLGNHEAEYGYLFAGASDPQNNIPAWDLFARNTYFPAPAPNSFYGGNNNPVTYSGGSLGLPRNYHAWEWGNALFIVLDPYWNTVSNPNQTNNAWNWSLGKTQYDWLKATLQSSGASYKFVFLHHLVGGTWTLADGVTANCAGRGGVEVAPYFEWGGKNTDGSDGFAVNRPGWDMPVHNLLVQNKVNVVFHGHDHLYGWQTLDGMVYLECPQPGTRNYTQLGSAADGKYSVGTLLPNSGHVRVTVGPNQSLAEYVRAYLPADENATTHNRDVSHSFTVASSNATLSNLVLSAGSLSPVFASGLTGFTVIVPNSTSSLTLTPTAAESGETLKVNSVIVASGSPSGALALNVGSNTVSMLVTAPDGVTTRNYVINITRQSALETWRSTWFRSSDNSGNASDTADPYHTGVTNLAVYALLGPAQNPATVQPLQLPQPHLSGGSFTTSFTEPAGVSDVIYGAEWSSDLQTWTPVADTGSGTQHVFSLPANTRPRVFLRLRITHP